MSKRELLYKVPGHAIKSQLYEQVNWILVDTLHSELQDKLEIDTESAKESFTQMLGTDWTIKVQKRNNTFLIADLRLYQSYFTVEICASFEWKEQEIGGDSILVVSARVIRSRGKPTMQHMNEIELLACAIGLAWSLNSSETPAMLDG